MAPVALDPVDLAGIERTAADLAVAAGERLLSRFRTALAVEYKDRVGENPVTEADRDAERFLWQAIAARYPGHGVLGEEGTEPAPGTPYVWVIDPLDGTTNFINGLPLWCVSIGVLWYGRPVAGAIFTPSGPAAGHALFRARLGGGAFLNDTPVRVTPEPEPTRKRLASLPAHYWQDMRFLTRKPNRLGETRTLGSMALELALVAAGTLQYGVFWGPKIWDVAGGAVIVREAGGLVLCRAGRGQPWSELHAFEPAQGPKSEPRSLRHWKGSLIAGSPPATRVLAADLRGRMKLPDGVKNAAGRIARRAPP
ncbi:MAG: inositol monophosphatase [Dehalococcoidia bacterium]